MRKTSSRVTRLAYTNPWRGRRRPPRYSARVETSRDDRFAAWLRETGIESPRRIAREGNGVILVSKFEEGFAARLPEALDRVPELFDATFVRSRYAALAQGTPRTEAWRLALAGILAALGPDRGIDRDQASEIQAGIDSVAALLDACLWSTPVLGAAWQPSAAELEARDEALGRMDAEPGMFTRYYGDFEGSRVENHCPGAPFARRWFAQAWETCGHTPES